MFTFGNLLLLSILIALIVAFLYLNKQMDGQKIGSIETSINSIASKLNQIDDIPGLVNNVQKITTFINNGQIQGLADDLTLVQWDKLNAFVTMVAGMACQNNNKVEVDATIPAGFLGKVAGVNVPPEQKSITVSFNGEGLKPCKPV